MQLETWPHAVTVIDPKLLFFTPSLYEQHRFSGLCLLVLHTEIHWALVST